MFCGNCGQKIEDSAKFCPFCGSQTQIPEEIKPAESAAPAETPAEPAAFVQPAAPVEAPAEPAAFVQPAASVEAPAEPAAFVQSAAPVETPAEPAAFVQPAAPVEAPTEPAAFVQPTAPVEASAEPAAFVQPAAPVKPKKKGKAGLVIGVSAAAVVLGGAAVGFFCFHDDITRMVMGEKEYTKMVNRNAFAGIIADDPSVQKYTDVLTTGLGSVVNTANRKSALSSVYNSSEDEPDLSAPRIQPINLLGSAFDSYDNVFQFIIGAPDGVKLSTESNVNIKLGSMLEELNNESVQKILDTVNTLKLRTVF
ncbi:MAG: zinc-ribbon domain-containing protein, partial [Ruminiclostridium sp.]|nr:zinc-ribbon domain-containing protein [Ruminiclostridium sp.]